MPSQPKKGRAGLVIGLVALLLICSITVCAGTFVFNIIAGQAKVRDAVRQAEENYDSATAILEKAAGEMKSFAEADDADAADAFASSLRAARDELSAARASIEPLPESEGRSAYLDSLASATEALDMMERMLGSIRLLTTLSGRMQEGAEAISDANGLLTQAVSAANRKDYARMKSKASSASKKYASAARIYREADKLAPEAGLKSIVEFATLRKKQSDIVVRMADAGRAGRTSTYNRLVDEQEELDAKAVSTADPAILSDADWFSDRLGEDQEAFEGAGERADAQRKAALEAFGL
jgi:hypothetical protein